MDLFIKQLKNKDIKAFKKFFKKHYSQLVQYANHYVYDVDLSKDIVQESFVYLWEHAESLAIKSSVTGYLKTMVRNKCINHLKFLKITENLDILEFNASLSTELEDENSMKDQTEDHYKKLVVSINSLPIEMAKVVKLKYFEDYKYQEIANELNISVNTVKTQLKRAKEKLNKRFMSLFF